MGYAVGIGRVRHIGERAQSVRRDARRSGSVVTYRLSAELTGSGSLSGLRLADTIPGCTPDQRGTTTLGSGGTTHVVTFKVRVD